MSDAAGRKPLDLGLKFVSAERALAAIRAGSRIYVGTGCAAPRNLLASLEAMVPRAPGPRVRQLYNDVSGVAVSAPHTRYRHRAFFVGSELRGLAGSGQLDYVPISLEEVPELYRLGGCQSTWRCFRFPHLMPGGLSASVCPWTSHLRS